MTMIVGDVIRGLLFLSIPLFPHLTWIYVAKFLAGVATQFWSPATSASMPNLVPKDKLERANQLSLLTTYGTAPLAAGLFSVLALVSEGISRVTPLFHTSNVDLALYFNAASYFISALTVYFIREIPKRNASGKISVPSTRQVHLGGLAVHRQDPGGARPGDRHGGRVRRGRRGGRPGLHLHHLHAARRQRRLGPGLRRDLRRHGARHGPRHAGCSATSAAAGCSA